MSFVYLQFFFGSLLLNGKSVDHFRFTCILLALRLMDMLKNLTYIHTYISIISISIYLDLYIYIYIYLYIYISIYLYIYIYIYNIYIYIYIYKCSIIIYSFCLHRLGQEPHKHVKCGELCSNS